MNIRSNRRLVVRIERISYTTPVCRTFYAEVAFNDSSESSTTLDSPLPTGNDEHGGGKAVSRAKEKPLNSMSAKK